ncbi:MAG TPA: galactokinase [Chitinophagaceae bacterium]|nr:galactokinase [Chitinophagaceae bacterium]HQV85565.1 galactokinase [Chitinophagaceae bacterium]HQX74219.1 galactokinase [Chitinophagaceae bacterium]HQZ74042.1 galactokinase [Chitinophagaceae bacterium]
MGEYRVPEQLKKFVTEKTIIVRSPGRINLIGEHTDYNDGFVLPAAIDKAVYVTIEQVPGTKLFLHSVDFNESVEIELTAIKPVPGHWSTYILGVADQFVQKAKQVSGFKLNIYGDVPLGAGLSSSAAVECAVAFALNKILNAGFSRKELALMAQAAEHTYAGVKCGIMDQFASLFGKKDNVIRLDCRSLDYEYFPLELNEYVVVLFDTQVKHSLASSEYNVRREQCEAGVALIQQKYPQVKNLRDTTIEMIKECISPGDIVYNRCKYVVEEIIRLQTGCGDLQRGDLMAFGQKMYATHHGLSKYYEVSCKELDYLVEYVQQSRDVIGARMMGGGFGGCTINIIKKSSVEGLVSELTVAYLENMGKELKHYMVNIEDGTSIIK